MFLELRIKVQLVLLITCLGGSFIPQISRTKHVTSKLHQTNKHFVVNVKSFNKITALTV